MEGSPYDPVSSPSDPWPVSSQTAATPNRYQRLIAEWMTDILVYTVVLNLFVEYSAAIIIDSFTISILTAVLLKLLLVAITAAKTSVWSWARKRQSRTYTIVGIVGVWAILFLSKFAILAAEDIVFGDHVELGGFVDVMMLAAGLVVAREAVHRAYLGLGAAP